MAFDLRNLSRLCYGNGFTLWAYRAMPGEHLALVDNAAYFADARGVMNPGDAIMVSDDNGTKLVTPFPRAPVARNVFLDGEPVGHTVEYGVCVTQQDIDSLNEHIAARAAMPEDPDTWGRGYDFGWLIGAKTARNALLGSRA